MAQCDHQSLELCARVGAGDALGLGSEDRLGQAGVVALGHAGSQPGRGHLGQPRTRLGGLGSQSRALERFRRFAQFDGVALSKKRELCGVVDEY